MFRGSLGSAPREPARHAGLRAGSVLGRLGLGALVLGRAFGALLGRGLLAHHGGGHDGRDGEIAIGDGRMHARSEEHTSELQSLMRNSYAVFCLKKKTHTIMTQQLNYLLILSEYTSEPTTIHT